MKYSYNYVNCNWGRSWRRGTNRDCKCDWLWVRYSRKWNIYFKLYIFLLFFAMVSRQNAALNSTTQYAMPAEFGIRIFFLSYDVALPWRIMECPFYLLSRVKKKIRNISMMQGRNFSIFKYIIECFVYNMICYIIQ